MKKEAWFGISIMALVVIGVFWAMPPLSQWTNGHLGLLMLAMIVIAIMLGFPTAFTLMGMGTMFAFFSYYSQNPNTAVDHTFDLVAQRAYAVMNNDVLISIPLFVFMGYLVETGQPDRQALQESPPGDLPDSRVARRRDGHHLRDLRHRHRDHRGRA